MAWTALTFAYGSLLTATKMTQLYDNITAFAAKDSGAPVLANSYVTEAMLAASAVAQGKLKTTTASGSLVVGSGGAGGNYSLTGGTFSWWTLSSNYTSGGVDAMFGNGDAAAGVLGFYSSANGITLYVDERYVQASPPYTHGPMFVFLAINGAGEIVHSRFAPDPPWAYHGPTNIVPDFIDKNGKAWRLRKLYNGLPRYQAIRDPATLRAMMSGTATVTYEPAEITLAYKDSDMNVVPHPFVGNDMTGLTVVMLKPGTPLMEKLANFCDWGEAREVRKLVVDDAKLVIDNTDLLMPNTPPGVRVVSAKWKLT